MNAGAYGGEMKDVVVETEYMDLNGQGKVLRGDEHEFGYRTSYILKFMYCFKISTTFKKGNKEEIKA